MGAALATHAGSANYDFNAQPPPDLNFVGNAEWRASGGVTDSGYVALFDSIDGQHAAVMLPDFDAGLIVKAFTFEADLRIGNPTGEGGRPADGFSISYARADDPVVQDLIQEPPVDNLNSFSIPGAPEGGTRTGLSICFDTWSGNTWPSGETDIEGIILRVDDVTKARIPMATRNGACDDPTSLQTGPYDAAADAIGEGGKPDGLCWAPLKVELDEAGKVTVTWKNTVIVDHVETGFSPSAGRLVFAGRTGGANENTHVDNVRITTVPSQKIVIGNPVGRINGFALQISDSGASILDPNSVVIKLDGTTITATSSKTGTTTTFDYTLPADGFFDSGSTHSVEISAKDTNGQSESATRSFTAPTFVTVPADLAVTGVDKTKPGFTVWVHQEGRRVTSNNNEQAEQMLAGDYGPNVADLSLAQPDGTFIDEDVINYEQSAGSAGNFQPDEQMPGIPGTTGSTDYIAIRALGIIEFPTAGFYTLGVNSDDGFRVRLGRSLQDRWRVGSVMLGEFNGGRGAGNTEFTFRVGTPGFYPIELIWEEGEGGASVEFYSKLADGTLVLVNDVATPGHLKVYRAGPLADIPYIASAKPGVSQGAFKMFATAATANKVEIVIKDGVSAASNVKLKFDGVAVTPTVNKVGDTTTVTYTDPMKLLGTHTVEVSYDYGSPAQTRTVSYSYYNWKAEPGDLPANSFNIEAEDFNYDGGKTIADASTMPYLGGAYDTLGAIEGVDYNNDDGQDSDLYRTEKPASGADENEVNMDSATSQRFATLRPGGYDVTTNHKIGWVGGGQWENYTRTIPAGIYTAYFGKSYDGWDNGQLSGNLALVTSDPSQPNQATTVLGTYNAPGSGGWGHNDLIPLQGPLGEAAYFKLPGGPVTLRANHGVGDFDFFTLVPSPNAPAAVVSGTPANGQIVNLNQKIEYVVQDFGTSLDRSTVKLEVDGTDVTAKLAINKAGDRTTISYTPEALYEPGSAHTAKLTFSDNGTPPTTKVHTASFTIYPVGAAGMFQIEAEDFNFDAGQTKAEASVFPYLGGAYAGLGAVEGVDYNNDDDNSSDVYRTEKPDTGANENEVNINENLGGRLGRQRGLWDVTVNHKIGWVGGPNEWYNYTRVLPAGNYKVYAALSFDGTVASQLKGFLERVTSDPTQPNQTVELLGYFDAPGTAALGGWGANDLVLMRDAPTGGSEKAVSLDGTQTLRFNSQSGDFDYLVFVPAEGPPPAPRFTSVTRNAQTGAITLTWEGGGKLEAATSLLGPWQEVIGASSPYTFTPNPAQPVLFGRIRR